MKKFREIAKNFNVFLFDAYGVFNINGKLESQALSVMEELVAGGKKVGIISNTTQTSAVAEIHYAKKGLIKGKHYHLFLTSGQIVYEAIQAQSLEVSGSRYYVFGTANFKNPDPEPALFSNSHYERVDNINEADFIYCGIPQINGEDQVKMDVFYPLLDKLVQSGLPLLCANPDMKALENGRFVIRQGSIAQAYKNLGGKVIFYGKPDARILDQAIALLNGNKEEALMVGDTLITDVLAANRAGIKACLTVSGGVTEDWLTERGQKVCDANIIALAGHFGVTVDYICFAVK